RPDPPREAGGILASIRGVHASGTQGARPVSATLEPLAEIKNAAPVAFVRRANIANGPQQVSNAATRVAGASRARESENPPNKLLEQQPNEWLDRKTTRTSVSVDQALEAVGQIPGQGPKQVRGSAQEMPTREACGLHCVP